MKIFAIADLPEGTLVAEGWDEALIGYGWRLNTPIAAYDRAKVMELLQKEMSEEEADEYISFNIEGAYVGEGTPLFITLERCALCGYFRAEHGAMELNPMYRADHGFVAEGDAETS